MKIELAKKLIMVLLIFLIIIIVLTLFLIHKNGDSDSPAITDPLSSGTSDSDPTTPPETSEPSDSTTPSGTDPVSPGTTEPPVVNPPIVDPPVVTAPPVTTPPVTEDPNTNKAPEGFSLDRSFETDTGVRINLIAECHATRNSDGSVNLTVALYLDHRALGMGARKCVLTVGNVSEKFTTERISQEDNTATKQLLHTVSGTFAYGETVDIYANVPVGLTNYGGIEIKTLTIDTSMALK